MYHFQPIEIIAILLAIGVLTAVGFAIFARKNVTTSSVDRTRYLLAGFMALGSLLWLLNPVTKGPFTLARWGYVVSTAPIILGLLLPRKRKVTAVLAGLGIVLGLAFLSYLFYIRPR